MKNRRMTILAVASALVLVLAVFFSFVILPLFKSSELPIEPPPEETAQTPDTAPPQNSGSQPVETMTAPPSASPNATPHPLSRLEITADNIQQLIETFDRPDSYTAKYTAVHYWQGGSGSSSSVYYVIPGYAKCARLDADGNAQTLRITGGGVYYEWAEGSTAVYTANAGQFTPENMGMLPIYDDEISQRISSASVEDIAQAAFELWNGVPSLSLTLIQGEHRYRFVFGSDYGELLYYEKAVDGILVYSCSMDSFDPTAPDNSEFMMPNGQSAILLG